MLNRPVAVSVPVWRVHREWLRNEFQIARYGMLARSRRNGVFLALRHDSAIRSHRQHRKELLPRIVFQQRQYFHFQLRNTLRASAEASTVSNLNSSLSRSNSANSAA